MSKHKELGHRILTPKYFKDIEAFKSLANQCGRYREDPEDYNQRLYEKITAHTEFMHSTTVK